MPETYEVRPASKPIDARVRPPGSKSITNRALVCAALAEGTSRLSGALDSDDTRVMIAAMQKLGINIDAADSETTLTVEGCGGRIPAASAELFVGNSGTTVRFLTAMLTLGHGRFRLDGAPRMRERPIGDLADALNQLGARVRCESPGGCPPVAIDAAGLPGGKATIGGAISSQYLSGLLMAAPHAKQPVRLAVDGQLVSKPYVHMTAGVMQAFGVGVGAGGMGGGVGFDADMRSFEVAVGGYEAADYAIEPDASAASYFWAAAAITGGRVVVEGLSPDALQGDV
ncbi:MAG: 3-phosphoshikimate 1-carboxyvinyltransferase, partial [Planctomycetota bacterium]